MFNPLRKLFPSTPQPALAAAGMSGTIPLIPSKFGGYTDPALEQKPRLLTRIADGLPGFLGGAGAVLAAKMATGALMTSVSAPALATVAAAAGVGAFVNQSVVYARDRHALLKQQASLPPVAGVDALSVAAKISRELKAYGTELKTERFWKGFATKGLIAGSLGASFGFAASNETVQNTALLAKEKAGGLLRLAGEKTINLALLAKEKVQSALASGDWKNPPKRLAEMTSGKAHANVAPKPSVPTQLAQTTDTKPQAQLSDPINTVPVDPPTPLEKIRILMEMKSGTPNVALEKLIEQAQEGKTNAIRMQAIKDLAVTRDLPVSKELRFDLLKIAAEGKNPQAIRDLAILTKGTVASAVVDAPKPSPILTERSIDSSVRERAAAFVRATTTGAEAAPPTAAPKIDVPQEAAAVSTSTAPLPTSEIVDRNADTLARAYAQQNAGNVHTDPARQFAHDYALNKAPVQIKDEAARCVLGLGNENGKNVINSMCSWFKAVVTPNDHVLVQSADQSLSAPYSPNTDQPVEKFTPEARRHFRDNDFLPKFGAQLQ